MTCAMCDEPITSGSRSGLCRSCSQEYRREREIVAGSRRLLAALIAAGYGR